jgi:hypothetical protein
MTTEKFICGDCKGITENDNNKKSSFRILPWFLFCFTGLIFPSFRRKRSVPKKCQYCNSDFLLPVNLPSTAEFLKQIEQSYHKKN